MIAVHMLSICRLCKTLFHRLFFLVIFALKISMSEKVTLCHYRKVVSSDDNDITHIRSPECAASGGMLETF